MAKENQTHAKYILLYIGLNVGAIYVIPIMTPIAPPIPQYNSDLYSILTPMYKIANEADVMPTLCIMKERFIASTGATFSTRVKTGKATAAPPSQVAPAIKLANTLVMVIKYLGLS